MRVEKALTQLLVREVKMHLKAENLKRTLESAYDYSVQGAFRCIDDWNYGYIDNTNLKRFLRNCGLIANKAQLTSIIRRFDTDGDAKINQKEFSELLRSQLSLNQSYSSIARNKSVIQSAYHISKTQLNQSSSKKRINITGTPKINKSQKANSNSHTPNTSSISKKKKTGRPKSANKTAQKQRMQLLE